MARQGGGGRQVEGGGRFSGTALLRDDRDGLTSRESLNRRYA
jgi:hypothetical protein